MPGSSDQRGVSAMELERDTLDKVMNQLVFAATDSTDPIPLTHIGKMTARLINRGHPAGYVTTDEGTFMVTVEIVSRATLDSNQPTE